VVDAAVSIGEVILRYQDPGIWVGQSQCYHEVDNAGQAPPEDHLRVLGHIDPVID
jgi:hypothetical protein